MSLQKKLNDEEPLELPQDQAVLIEDQEYKIKKRRSDDYSQHSRQSIDAQKNLRSLTFAFDAEDHQQMLRPDIKNQSLSQWQQVNSSRKFLQGDAHNQPKSKVLQTKPKNKT